MYAKMKAKREAAEAAAAAAEDSAAASSSSAPLEADKTKPLSLEARTITAPKKSVLVIFGATNHADMGKKAGNDIKSDATPNLETPHRLLAGLGDVRICFIAAGSQSAHSVAIAVDGSAFAWGRNDAGQLGLGDLQTRGIPELVLKGTPLKAASTGKAHTVWLTSNGELMASGACKQGCVGPAAPKKADTAAKPLPITPPGSNPRFVAVASGTNFNLAIDAEGDVWSWGWSENGVLGHGTDGEHNVKEGSVKLSYEAQPTPKRISRLVGHGCIDVACGAHHCAAVDKEGVCFTWGAGGYGRLGHKNQEDVWTPKPLMDELRAKGVTCGAASTAFLGWPVLRNGIICTGAPSFFMCGRVRGANQNAWMYPKPEEELRGWNIFSFALGAGHNVVHADDAVISWGSGCQCGELGLQGKKSSAAPAKVSDLDGASIAQVACGVAHTLLLVEDGPSVAALPVFQPVNAATADATLNGGAVKGGKAKDVGSKRSAGSDSPAESKGKKTKGK